MGQLWATRGLNTCPLRKAPGEALDDDGGGGHVRELELPLVEVPPQAHVGGALCTRITEVRKKWKILQIHIRYKLL